MAEDQTATRFSQFYSIGPEALPDSKRARLRVATLLKDLGAFSRDMIVLFVRLVEHELGVSVRDNGYGYFAREFVQECELQDFLDLISLMHGLLQHPNFLRGSRERWISECRRLFAEERLRYVINDAGGVRFAADAEFEARVQATVQDLGRPEFRGALHSFDKSLEALSATQPDGKAAIRDVFEAVEIVFKMLCPGPSRIGAIEIKDHLWPKLDAEYAGDATARRAAQKLAKSLGEWVDAAHFYRHGQLGDDPVPPPLDLAGRSCPRAPRSCGGSLAFTPSRRTVAYSARVSDVELVQ
jgi:hypothetical protein